MSTFWTSALVAFIVYILFVRSENEAYAAVEEPYYAPSKNSLFGNIMKKVASKAGDAAKKVVDTAKKAKDAVTGKKADAPAAASSGGCPACVMAPCPSCPSCPKLELPAPCPTTKWTDLTPQNFMNVSIMLVLIMIAARAVMA